MRWDDKSNKKKLQKILQLKSKTQKLNSRSDVQDMLNFLYKCQKK